MQINCLQLLGVDDTVTNVVKLLWFAILLNSLFSDAGCEGISARRRRRRRIERVCDGDITAARVYIRHMPSNHV